MRLKPRLAATTLCLLILLGGCATSPKMQVAATPKEDAELRRPVQAPVPKKGKSASNYAADTLGALGEANAKIQQWTKFYDDVRERNDDK